MTFYTSYDKVQPTYQGSIAEEDVWLEAHYVSTTLPPQVIYKEKFSFNKAPGAS